MNYYEHHIGDYAEATAHLSFIEDAAYSRLIRKYYATEKPLPADIKAVQRLVGARTREERAAVEQVLQEFFDLREDGWHQSRCDVEIGVYQAGEPEREQKRANKDTRLKRHRAIRAAYFEALRATGQYPAWDTKTETLRDMLKRSGLDPETLAATATATLPDTKPATAPATPETATQTPDTRHQSPVPSPQKKEEEGRAKAAAPAPSGPPPEANGHQPTPAGAICRAMKAAGLQAVNPGDPRLLELIRQGATTAEFEGLAAEAVDKGKGFAWVLTVLQARRKEAGDIALTPKPAADPMAWANSRATVIDRGCQLGIGPWNEVEAYNRTGPSWATYRAKVIAADERERAGSTTA